MNRVGSLARQHYQQWIRWTLLLVVAYFAASYIAVGYVRLVSSAAQPSTLTILLAHVVMLAFMVVIMAALPFYMKRGVVSRQDAGLGRTMTWRDIGLGLLGFVVYGVLAVIIISIARFLPGFDSNQVQQLGLNGLTGVESIIGFFVLVMITPFLEELLFRGILFGKLRQARLPFWPTALLVSALFGLAHGQWNVALDVFCLSMVACYLRETTQSVWAGVIVHMLKNAIAFYFTFVAIHSIGG